MVLALFLAEGLVAFCALAFEVIAARLVAPHAGMSTDTWTAIIAAFLLALAAGNAVGGRLAERGGRAVLLRRAALATAAGGIAVAGVPLFIEEWDALVLAPAPLVLWRVVVFVAAPCIPAGVLFGIAPPLLMMSLIAHGGPAVRVGAMYAAGAAGSVLGVLSALWLLLDRFGVRMSLVAVGALALAAAALMAALSMGPQRRLAAS
jgi:MFS family permease